MEKLSFFIGVNLINSVVQDTIFKIVSCIFKIQDSILSCILRYFLKVSLSCIFKILFNSILTHVEILLEDTFPKILFIRRT